MKIIYYNNCWFTNVGEAFIDIGSMNIINKIWNHPKVACISDMSDWYSDDIIRKNTSRFRKPKLTVNSAKMYEYLEADYFVMSGMFASERYLESPGRTMVDTLVNKGAKLILLGVGSEKYSEQERDALSKYYEEIRPELIIARDHKTYEAYKNCAEAISGLDCAFWIKDSFDPRGFSKKLYNVYTFNRSQEPQIDDHDGLEIIRPWHMQWFTSLDRLGEDYLLSDTPYDYLTVYANANRVYTDLVHATIPSLQYGVPVKYYYIDSRSNSFASVENIKTDELGFMTVDEKDLSTQKDNLIKKIKDKLRIADN